MTSTRASSVRSSNESLMFALEHAEDESPDTLHAVHAGIEHWARKAREALPETAAAMSETSIETARQRLHDCATHASARLDLSGLQLSSLPASVANMRHLTHLDLSNNAFDQLPASIEDLSTLEHLDLSHNAIAALPSELPLPFGLAHLKLDHNPLRHFPDELISRLQRGLRLTCRNTLVSHLQINSVRHALGAQFPEDLFQSSQEAWAKDVQAASLERSRSLRTPPSRQNSGL